jgi:catechol 2,3-dioxygenase-like lactoylglutathione lyase family enzyme
MEIGASLAQLELTASDAAAAAEFYARTFRLQVAREGEAFSCRAPGRELRFLNGEGGQLYRVSLRFESPERFEAYRQALVAQGIETVDGVDDAFSVRDPEGRLVRFLAPGASPDTECAQGEPSARLQHFAVRTPGLDALLDFYVNTLHFMLSDRVLNEEGVVTAAFLRTDEEHHVMAIFRAPMVRFDHFSCETQDWNQLRDWADHMAAVGVDLAWGIGRHGPGNDTFFMVRDADGNMGEISSDLERCAPGRPQGVWKHRPQTLNRWGVALMRC